MDYKEEYQKALERAKKGLPIDEVFPELKESEDEKIIDDAIQIIRASRLRCAEYGAEADKHLKAIAYLEKQKEQKPSEWSEEDENNINKLLAICSGAKRYRQFAGCDQELVAKLQKWLKSFPERFNIQTKQEWSKEDEKMLEHIISDLREFRDCETDEDLVSDYEDEITWLKFLRPQPHWKPSEEQIDALEWMLTTVSMKDGGRGVVLKNLINDIKKL